MAGIGSTTSGLSASALSRMQGAGLDADVIDIASRALTPAAPSPSPAPSPTPSPSPTPDTTQPDASQLQQPSAEFPTLVNGHVMILRGIGTPEAILQQLAANAPNPDWMGSYIQGEIMQNPEGWDAYVGNPVGTARAGLLQLDPNVQLPAPGQGTPGYTADGGSVGGSDMEGSGADLLGGIPGVTTPLIGPEQNTNDGMNDLLKVIIWGAAAVGVGLLIWKFAKGRGGGGVADGGMAAKAAKAVEQAFGGGRHVIGGGANGVSNAGGTQFAELMLKYAKEGGLSTRQAMMMAALAAETGGGAIVGGALAGGGGGIAANAFHVVNGFGPTTNEIAQVANAVVTTQQPWAVMSKFFLDSKALDVAREVGVASAFGSGGAVSGANTLAKGILEGIAKAL